jgi:probable rRNA maturation factor
MSLILTNTTRSKYRVPFLEIKNDILGASYQLSLALVGEKRARLVNQRARHKDYVPNVLSFPLSKTAGEIYLTPSVSKREARNFEHTEREHLIFLYIHGLLHLKGYDHGRRMEDLEVRFLKKYR